MQRFAGIIAALGNPGRQYATTRHNFGFMVLDRLVDSRGGWESLPAVDAGGDCRAGALTVTPGRPKWLALEPMAYMNRSGPAVARACRRFAVDPADLVVVHDDLDIELGRMKLRKGGSDAGHNGVGSVIAELGSEAFLRLRLGIGRPPGRQDPADYVLSAFDPAELAVVDAVAAAAVDGLRLLSRMGRDAATRHVNGFAVQAPSDQPES